MKYAPLCCALLLAPFAFADALRDPTRPPVAPVRRGAAPSADPTPSLTAIMGVAGARRAILDGRVVSVGSRFGSIVIDEVFDDGIRYHRAGVRHELHLPRNPLIKQPSKEPARQPTGVQ